MGSRYLTDLASVCRGAGLAVQEEPGWQTRSRGSGGYDPGRPTHVMIHHTASNPSSDGQADVNYCCYNSADRPLANLYLSRSGKVWIMAAGATNTNGKGQDTWGGGVPNDSMNTYAIGIEAANTGTGETWSAAQQDAYVKMTKALCSHYAIPNNNVRGHVEWAPERKIDPAGPSQWASSGTWDMHGYRQSCVGSTPPPLPVDEDEPMDYLELMGNATQYSLFARTGIFVVNITNAERTADKGTRNPDPPTVRTSDATVLKALILVGEEPVWYDGSKWPPASAFGGHLS